MVLKTFSVQEEIYDQFSQFCKQNGFTISKQIELFMVSIVEKDPKVKREYVEKLEWIRKGKFIRVKNFAGRYGI